MKIYKKIIVLVVITTLFATILTSIASSSLLEKSCFKNDEKEYWALIIGVGIYKNRPDKEVGSIPDAENLYNALIKDERWDEDHIKLITGEKATKFNIIRGLRWLDRKEDKNDVCLLYFSSHGGSLSLNFMNLGLRIPIDLPPFDEEDRSDEIFATYKSLQNKSLAKYTLITDDELRFYINRLESKEMCMIFECCHAGGFNDLKKPTSMQITNFIELDFKYDFDKFRKGLGEEIEKEGRVILMSSKEDSVGWSIPSIGGVFTLALLESINKGFGDLNKDGNISAEEAFNYTKTRIEKTGEYAQTPTICDDYDGELNLVKTDYQVDLFETVKNVSGWKTVDHTEESNGNLWHISEKNYISPQKSWGLCDETNSTYNSNMNNSLVSPNITVSSPPVINFNFMAVCKDEENFFFEISSDNWNSFDSFELTTQDWTTDEDYTWYIATVDFENEDWSHSNIIQIRFRFQSEDNTGYSSGFIYVDDIVVHSKI